VSTFDVFDKLGYKEHRKLKLVISDNMEEFVQMGLMPLERRKPPKASKGGRPDESYLLNEDQFLLLLVLAKNSKEAVMLKVKITKEFVRMKKELAEIASNQSNEQWLEQRNSGKVSRRKETDVIKDFIDYAKAQGGTPKGCDKYYANISSMENKALFIVEQKYKNLRDVLGIADLSTIQNADHIVAKASRDGMDQETHDRDI